MGLQDLYNAAVAVLESHNAVIGPDRPGFIPPDKFIDCIKSSGGTTEERLKGFSQEDILACLGGVMFSPKDAVVIAPRVLAKEIANIWRGKEVLLNENANVPSEKKAGKMTIPQLVENFDPEDYSNPVGKRLNDIAHGRRFVVFESGRVVDKKTTLDLLLEIKSGRPEQEMVNVGGKPKRVYKLGELPDNFAEQNPLYPARPLRPDGTCDQTGRNWQGVSMTVRQLVFIARTITNEIDVEAANGLMTANAVMNIVTAEDAEAKIRQQFRKASLKFDELAETGNLPKLKIALGSPGAKGERSPFEGGKKVVWADAGMSNHYLATTPDDPDRLAKIRRMKNRWE